LIDENDMDDRKDSKAVLVPYFVYEIGIDFILNFKVGFENDFGDGLKGFSLKKEI
jgi:hypothetical protein